MGKFKERSSINFDLFKLSVVSLNLRQRQFVKFFASVHWLEPLVMPHSPQPSSFAFASSSDVPERPCREHERNSVPAASHTVAGVIDAYHTRNYQWENLLIK